MANSSNRIDQRIASIAAARPLIVEKLSPPPSNRKVDRQPVYRHGRLKVAGGVKIDCIIVDLSPAGAKVELDGASALPDVLALKIVMLGETRRARVVWRRENSAGLSFVMERKSPFGSAGASI